VGSCLSVNLISLVSTGFIVCISSVSFASYAFQEFVIGLIDKVVSYTISLLS
jgi:hypothetical protein